MNILAEIDIGILIVQIIVGLIVAGFFLSGIRIIRPTHRAAVETLGKYTRFQNSGITFIIPFIQKMYSINITEQLVDVMRQEVITKDNLNCSVDAQVYFKVGDSEVELKNALYRRGCKSVITSFNGGYVGYVIPRKYFNLHAYESFLMAWYGPNLGDYFVDLLFRMTDKVAA